LTWNEKKININPVYTFKVRRNKNNTYGIFLHSQIPKIALPKYKLGRYSTLVFTGKCSWRISVPWFISRGREKILLVCLQVRRTRKNKQTFSLRKCRIAGKTIVNGF
jgi:hypothetical protein